MSYLLGIDIGTSGTKSLIIDTDKNGAVVGSATVEYPLYTPKPLWAEQNPEDWWQAVAASVRKAVDNAGIKGGDIRGIGLSGQMHGAVFLDSQDRVLRPSILWCDQRTAAECDWITQTVGAERVIELISNPVLTGFTAGKIVWLRNNEPDIYAKVAKVLLPKDYIRLRLTGEYATEVSDASGTALFNVKQRKWSYEMLDAVGIPSEWMPNVYESPEVSGHLTPQAADEIGLSAGTPVVGGGGDQAAGAVGSGVVRTGIISSTVGTSGVVFAFADEPVVDPKLRVHTFCHAVPGRWYTMGASLAGGMSLRWFRDQFYNTRRGRPLTTENDLYAEMIAEALKAPPGCDGLFFSPHLGGRICPAAPEMRGAWLGFSWGHTQAHFIRAVLESVAYEYAFYLSILRELVPDLQWQEARVAGGGARSPAWNQIKADVLGVPYRALQGSEFGAWGSALIAGKAAGLFTDLAAMAEEHARLIEPGYPPEPERQAFYASRVEQYIRWQELLDWGFRAP